MRLWNLLLSICCLFWALGGCTDDACSPGQIRCNNRANVETCNAATRVWEQTEVCSDGCSAGSCLPVSCTPNGVRCNDSGNVETCNTNGDGWEEAEVCNLGCADGECNDQITVWAIDDGERIHRDDVNSPLKAGTSNPIWSPGQPIRLFGLRDETVAFQVIVEASSALQAVTVDLERLTGPSGAKIENDPGANDPTSFIGRWIERFVEHYYYIERASHGLGGSDSGHMLGWVPDALIPTEVAPDWSPYPLVIQTGHNGAVWIDITIPKDATAGTYQGTVVVKEKGAEISQLPVELTIGQALLPAWPLDTMLYYEREEVRLRIGADVVDDAEKHLKQLLHRHRISPMLGAMSVEDVNHHLKSLDGSLYTQAENYQGPGENIGDNLLSLGTYGGFGNPDAADLTAVEAIADRLSEVGLLDDIDVFVYVVDETCEYQLGKDWMDLKDSSNNPNMEKVLVGWTCSSDPSNQVVELIMSVSERYDVSAVEAARALGKEVWIYNGAQPHSGAFSADFATIATRVNGWISAMHDIRRWFFWESTFWYDWNPGGEGAYDPFVQPETFHNQHGDYMQGDGVLVYPGCQVDLFTDHSIGMVGVVASIRLKNWRRGIQDAGYYQLAHAIAASQTENIANTLIPVSLGDAPYGGMPAWPQNGQAFFSARKTLWDIINQ